MKRLALPAIAAGCAAVIVAAAAAGNSFGSHGQAGASPNVVADVQMSAAQDESSVVTSAPFPEDAKGWSYGAIPHKGAAPYSDWPDLVAVSLTDSTVGFIRKTELRFSDSPADNPTSPAQMLSYAKTLPTTLTIYAPDGTTVLGSMPVGPATSVPTP